MKAAIAGLLVLAACGGSKSSPQCGSNQSCVQANGGDKCIQSCAVQADCPSNLICTTWEVCCSNAPVATCTAALAHVCCPASGC